MIKCTKKEYSKKEAQSTINFLKTKKQKNKKPIRYYKCENCDWYHLTSHK